MRRKKRRKKNSNEREISNFPNKDFKEGVIRMLNKLRSRIEELREYFNRVRKCTKEPIRDEEYNYCKEEYIRRNRQKISCYRRKDYPLGRQNRGNNAIRRIK